LEPRKMAEAEALVKRLYVSFPTAVPQSPAI
jgi:hypothetical protein